MSFNTQFTGNNILKIFSTDFKITQGGLLNVFLTPSGSEANEDNDLLSPTNYTLTYATTADFTLATVTLNIAPATGDILTLSPVANGAISVDFTQNTQLIPSNLNLAYAQHTTPVDYSFSLYQDLTPRYPINIDKTTIQYSILLPALKSKGFWRRNTIANGVSGAGMAAQDYNEFISEVGADISQATSALDEIKNTATANQITFDLISNSIAWLNITAASLTVYVNGLRQPQNGVYTVVIASSPTIVTPSTVVFTTGLASGDIVLIDRAEPVASDTNMNIDGGNAIFDTSTKLASRSLDNVSSISKTGVATSLGNETDTASTIVVRDSAKNINATKLTTTNVAATSIVTTNNTVSATTTAEQTHVVVASAAGLQKNILRTSFVKGSTLQVLSSNLTAGVVTSLIIPFDNTIPLITEGFLLFSLTITPKNTNSRIKIELSGSRGSPSGNNVTTFSLFRNSVCIFASGNSQPTFTSIGAIPVSIITIDSPSSSSAVTYSIRFGGSIASPTSFGIKSDTTTPMYGSAIKGTFILTEIAG